MREPIRFNGIQARAIGHGIADIASRYALHVHAAGIMPDHVHMVFARRAVHAETWVGYFKRAATKALVAEKLHPFAGDRRPDGSLPSVWAQGGWKVFLHNDVEIRREIEYVEKNPIRAGLRAQHWSFVSPYPPCGQGG
jgi:REP element-mobilizing transposase RayT